MRSNLDLNAYAQVGPTGSRNLLVKTSVLCLILQLICTPMFQCTSMSDKLYISPKSTKKQTRQVPNKGEFGAKHHLLARYELQPITDNQFGRPSSETSM